jgi:2-hydroxychromene-2-carboxylate isomerase
VILYVDPQSPYAYLADARDVGAELQVIALGAIMVKRGWGSWAHTDSRAGHIAAVEERAEKLGLPPLTWPEDWPAQTLAPARIAFWAEQQGRLPPFLHAYWRRVFAENRPAGDEATLAEAVGEAGLDGPPVIDQALKDALRARTDAAWDAGVRGIPTLSTGSELIFGDDRIAEWAGAVGGFA